MVAANVEITHQRLLTLENRTSMMTKAIMPVLSDLKNQIFHMNQKLASQYRMMNMAHTRYNLLFRKTHQTLKIHHLALLLFKNYLTIQVGTLQRIHRQYSRSESALDDTLIGIESLSSGYLTHCILDPQVLARYLEVIVDNMEDTALEYEPVFTSVHQNYGNSLASFTNVVLLQCGSCPFRFKSFLIKFGIRNNSSSSDVLYIQASISPKYESK